MLWSLRCNNVDCQCAWPLNAEGETHLSPEPPLATMGWPTGVGGICPAVQPSWFIFWLRSWLKPKKKPLKDFENCQAVRSLGWVGACSWGHVLNMCRWRWRIDLQPWVESFVASSAGCRTLQPVLWEWLLLNSEVVSSTRQLWTRFLEWWACPQQRRKWTSLGEAWFSNSWFSYMIVNLISLHMFAGKLSDSRTF